MSDGQFEALSIEELQPHFTQFEIEAFVAVGGMGAVYRAKQISVDRTVALKVLPPELAQDPQFRRRFAMEAKAMAKLSHRNLVQLYDFGQDRDVVWMIQEWVKGRTVYELLEKEGTMDPMEAAALVAQACEGLGYAHKRGIVHRDVKPGNMMEDQEGLLKLMDFGLARATQAGPEGLRAQSGKRYATPEYAAPELWDPEKEVDHRVDIFALGVLLFEALTGQRPAAPFRKPSELRAGLDKRFDDIVVRALQGRPENRYGSCAELLKALRGVVMPPAKKVPKAPTGQVKLMTGTTGAVKLNTSTGAVAVAAPRPTTTAVPTRRRRRTSGTIGVLAAVAVLLAIVGGGGAVWWSKAQTKAKQEAAALAAEQDEAARIAKQKQEKIRRERKAAAEARKKQEEQQRQAARKAEEERKRQAAMNAAAAAQTKDPAVLVKEALAKLDADTRRAAKEPIAKYRGTLSDLTQRFVAMCDEGKTKAAAEADLDAVIFWMKERAGVQRGTPGEGGAEAPDAVVAMRTEWEEKLDPLIDKIEEMRSGYLEKCEALGEGELPDETRDMLAERWKNVSHLAGFMGFCDGTDPRASGSGAVPPVVPEVPMPDELRVPYDKLQKTLVDLEAKGDRGRMKDMIKSFGRGLAGEERKLTMALQVPEAVAVRAAKLELLEMLKRLESGGSLTGEQRKEGVFLVKGGSLADEMEVSARSHWRRKGLVLESTDEAAWLRSSRALGSGDFVVRARMALERIGSTWATIGLGETTIHLDNREGNIEMGAGGVRSQGVTGKQIGSLIKAGEMFDLVLERKGLQLKLTINGQDALRSGTHAREIGVLRLHSRETTMQIESIKIEGTMIDRISYQRLTRNNRPSGRIGRVQMVGTGNDGLVCMFHTWQGGEPGLFAARSRNGGEKWDDYETVVGGDDLDGKPLASFGAASNPDRDVIWAVYTVGESNHRVLFTQGRSRGRNWSKSQDITEDVKPGGRSVWMAGGGVVLETNERKRGRILLPMIERGENQEELLYVVVSESGRDWSRIGPVMRQCHRGAEMLEDSEGRIWLASGAPPKGRSQFHRRWVVSEDGGDTWSDPKVSMLPDTGITDGGLAKVDAGRGQTIWYYATTDGPLGADLPEQTNLTLYGSKDRGKTWTPLKRFLYGRGKYPTIVPLGPDKCAVAFRKESQDWGAQEVRVAVLSDLWEGK